MDTQFTPVAGAGQAAAIRCAGLSRSYGTVQAFKNLDLNVPYGSIYGFLGRNGAGKTTTIRILAGLVVLLLPGLGWAIWTWRKDGPATRSAETSLNFEIGVFFASLRKELLQQ